LLAAVVVVLIVVVAAVLVVLEPGLHCLLPLERNTQLPLAVEVLERREFLLVEGMEQKEQAAGTQLSRQ
jgi:hypothetical protein